LFKVKKKIDPASIAFDVDGVIADTMRLFLDIARDEFHVNGVNYEDITCYSLVDCLDMDPNIIDAVVARILDGHYRVTLKPIAGAREVLARLGNGYGPILFVTARPHLGPIDDWMLDLLPLDKASIEMIATGTSEAKTDVLLDRKISCFVEDRLETCFALQPVGITPVLFKQPWNRKPHPFVEVNSWKELGALIDF
jgi:5'(3')-deoxyribonucleotidase